MDACETHNVFEIKWVEHKKPIDKLVGKVNGLIDEAHSLLSRWRV